MRRHVHLSIRLAVLIALIAGLALGLDGDESGEVHAAAGLSISVSDSPDPVAPGGIVTYTVTVTNSGAATPVLIHDTLSGVGLIQSATPSIGVCGTPSSTEVTCDLGILGTGVTAVIEIEKLAVVPTGGIVGLLGEDFGSSSNGASRLSATSIGAGAAGIVAVGLVLVAAAAWLARKQSRDESGLM